MLAKNISNTGSARHYIVSIYLLIFLISILYSISDSQEVSQNRKFTILQNLAIVDVISGKCMRNYDIVLSEERIWNIIEHKSRQDDKSINLIDLTGKYAIPGLIESHNHISGIPERSLTVALRKGMTALRDMGGDGEYLRELQKAVFSGELSAPDIYFSALLGGRELIMNDTRAKLSTPPSYALGDAPWMRVVADNCDFRQIIKEAKDCGATGIKMYSHLTPDRCKQLSIEAKRQGLKVWAHSFVYPATVPEVVTSGAEAISHAAGLLLKDEWEPNRDGSIAFDSTRLYSKQLEEILELMKRNEVRLDATLAITQRQINSISDSEKADKLSKMLCAVVKKAYDYGIKIVAGTDYPQFPATDGETLILHREIKTLVNDVGLPPIDALRAATINGAEILGIDSSHGSIEVGKIANIVILDGNPLEDINNIEQVHLVIKNGKFVKSERVD